MFMARRLVGLVAVTLIAVPPYAGPLDPPAGSIASTSKPLAEIEPRIPISAATTPGDAFSLFKITQPGSYYLTGNITGVAGRNGIDIAIGGVCLDLNGFTLVGAAGSLNAITSNTPGPLNIEIRTGSIRNWGGHGIDLGSNGSTGVVIRDICSSVNGGDGIRSGAICAITGCIAYANATDGFVIDHTSTVTNCSAYSNLGIGFRIGSVCVVTACASRTNQLHGFFAASGCILSGNAARNNGQDGIRLSFSAIITGNMCSTNGSDAIDGAGIRVTGSDNRIEGNNCTGQDTGIKVDSAGNVIVRNICAGNTTNWNFFANNVFGPILDRTAPASPAVNGNNAASSLGSTDANANYSY